jgi:ADP-heptose:LPS heptosyltransferase
MLDNIIKILVVNLGGIGDIVLSTPALRSLRKAYPDAEISILIVRRCYEIAEDFPYIDKIIFFDMKLFGKDGILKIFDLRKQKFDFLINMRTIVSWIGAIKMAVLFNIIGARHTVGRNTEGKGFFFDYKFPEKLFADRFESEYDLGVIKLVGGADEELKFDIKVGKEESESIDHFLSNSGVKKDDLLIGINPGATWLTRRWPLENFASLIRKINNELRCEIVITGSKNEFKLAEKLKKLSGVNLIIASGKTTARELVALINRTNLFITNDTGTMHLAMALKKPTVAIFGPGDVTRFTPPKEITKILILYSKAECAPCNRVKCRSMKCLKSISPDEVLGKVKELLRN